MVDPHIPLLSPFPPLLRLNPKPSIGTFETLPARSCQQIRDVLDCARVTPSGQYWIKVSSGGGLQDCCQQGEDFEVMKVLKVCLCVYVCSMQGMDCSTMCED